MSQIFLKAKQALPWNILCGIGIRFNFICDEMFGRVSDEPALRTGRCLQAFNRRKPFASIMSGVWLARNCKHVSREETTEARDQPERRKSTHKRSVVSN